LELKAHTEAILKEQEDRIAKKKAEIEEREK